MTAKIRYAGQEASPQRERVLDMYADGTALRVIAKELGYASHGYVVRIVSQARSAGDKRAARRRGG